VQLRFVNAFNSWRTPESIRNPIQARRGRNGRSVSRGGYKPAPQNSDQDIAIAAKAESTISGAILHVGNLVVLPPPITINQRLFQLTQMPDQMTFVPGGDYRLAAWARPTDMKVRLDDFFIDRYEVSNRDYREFINAGCYLKREYWKYPFVRDGKALSWEEAINGFKDRTGLAGPRSWTNQNFRQS
jgi:formylglycine-generating enzyme required for sulfatase activity